MSAEIRVETIADHSAIRTLVTHALGSAEAELVAMLRADDVLWLSLVAVESVTGRVVGSIAVSALEIDGGKAGALAPLAVAQDFRLQGIASRLIARALDLRRAAGDDLMFVLGDTHVYGCFGFSTALAERFETPWDGPHQQAIALSARGRHLMGAVRYPRAFAGFA